MDFKIDPNSSIGLTDSPRPLEVKISSDPLQSEKDSLAPAEGDAAVISKDFPETTSLIVANNAKQFLEVAKDATSAILDLRQQQLDYATQASKTADPTQQEKLGDEINAISTEISRVSTAATYNGQNTLQGNTTSLGVGTVNYQGAVSSGNVQYLANSLTLDVSSQTSAATTVTTLSDVVIATSKAADGVAASYEKASALIEQQVTDSHPIEPPAQVPTDISEAEALVKGLVQKIAATFNQTNEVSSIIASNLDPERVQALLEPG